MNPPTASTKTVSSRAFNQNSGLAKKAAKFGPVIVTERGRPAYVLLSIEQYEILVQPELSVAEALSQKEGEFFDFDPPKLSDNFIRPAAFD